MFFQSIQEDCLQVLLQLILPENKEFAVNAQNVWEEVARPRGLDLTVMYDNEPACMALIEKLSLTTLPALIIDGVIKVIGIPDKITAEKVLDKELNTAGLSHCP